MIKIKIISNPYKQEIQYKTYEENSGSWIDVGVDAPNGRLREEAVRKCFFPFNVKEILEIIVKEYFLETKGAVEVIFEGTKDEFSEIMKVCQEENFRQKSNLYTSHKNLEKGKYIQKD